MNNLTWSQFIAVVVSEIDIGKALKGNTAGLVLLSNRQRSTSIAVSGSVDAIRGQEENGHGALDHFLGIQKPFYQTLLLIDDSCS